ncbi:PadR family transcriptional regulator [Candidatus Lokiarchaeum ossiferum]|uniref:PadR family transcriptional regulator n=1 Tax=Candidatus Lokiarchaeum ossiferum TaxID=2951803 RepID=UPI00352DC581
METDEESILSDFTRFYLLVLLYEEPIHGYGLRQKFEKRLGKSVGYSLIYSYLEKLSSKNYVDMEIIKIGQKEKKKFHLTEEGKIFAEKMFQRFSGIIDTAIEPNIQICAGCGIRLYQNAYQETINGKKILFCCTHCASAFKNHAKMVH